MYPLGARSKEQSERRKEVYIEAGKPVYSWSSFEKSKPWGEGSQARLPLFGRLARAHRLFRLAARPSFAAAQSDPPAADVC